MDRRTFFGSLADGFLAAALRPDAQPTAIPREGDFAAATFEAQLPFADASLPPSKASRARNGKQSATQRGGRFMG